MHSFDSFRHAVLLAACVLLAAFSPPPAHAQETLAPGMVNPGYHETPAWFKNSFLDIRADAAEAKAAGKRVLLYFYQDGCPYCKKLLEDNLGQRTIADKTREHFDVVSINIWGDREVTGFDGSEMTEKAFAAKLRVMFTPTLLFLDEQSRVVLRINGYYAPHRFNAALDYVAGGHERAGSFRDYEAKVMPAPAQGSLHIAPGYLQPPYDLTRAGAPKDRKLLVLFEQRQCAACDELHLDIFERAETQELLRRFDIVLLDMWSKTPVRTPDGKNMTAADWARALNIQYSPSLVFFAPDGKEVFRSEAYLKAFHIQSILDYVASAAYAQQPHFQRYIEARAATLREQGVEVDLMR